MENQGGGKRHSSLPPSIIQYMIPDASSSTSPLPSETSENSSAQFSYAPPPSSAFTLRPIASLPAIGTLERRRLREHSSDHEEPESQRAGPSSLRTLPAIGALERRRLREHSSDYEEPESQRAGPSSVRIETHRERRLGGTENMPFRPPIRTDYTSFTFPPIPHYLRPPYIPGEAGPSSVVRASRDEAAPQTVARWQQFEEEQSPLDEPEKARGYGDRERQYRRRSPEIRHPPRPAAQRRDSLIGDPSASGPTYLPPPAQSNPPVAPFQGLRLTQSGPAVYYPNPYVSQTHSFTQLAPRYFPRYYDPSPIPVHTPGRDYRTDDLGYDSSEASTSRKPNVDHKKRKQSSVVDEDGDDGDEDETPRRKVSRKTEVACDFCRRRKLRCTGARPTCETCRTRNEPCKYVDHVRRRGPGKAPKGSKKLAKRKGRESDPFATVLDVPHISQSVKPPESVASVDTLSQYSPSAGPTTPLYAISPAQVPSFLSRIAPPSSHIPSQSPGASTSEHETGTVGERRDRKRTASQRDRSKRTRRGLETEGTDDTHDAQDDDRQHAPP